MDAMKDTPTAHHPFAERFMVRVSRPTTFDPADSCWEWNGRFLPDGYGMFSLGERDVLAHRFAYELYRDAIPEGLQLDHLCRNRWCVNPHHLEPVTSRENTMRGMSFSAVNARKTHCPQGHPYDETNTIHYAGRRYCRACRDARNKNAITSREEMTA